MIEAKNTPHWIAQMMVKLANPKKTTIFYEPMAGSGTIARQIAHSFPKNKLFCSDLNINAVKSLGSEGFHANRNDVLNFPTYTPYSLCVIYNPPFKNNLSWKYARSIYNKISSTGGKTKKQLITLVRLNEPIETNDEKFMRDKFRFIIPLEEKFYMGDEEWKVGIGVWEN